MALGNQFQAEVARVALAAAREHGFALAGGNGLAAYGIISRLTEDIDLFAAGDGAVQAAAGLVAAALTQAGFAVEEVAGASDLAEVIEGFERDMAEYEGSRGGELVRLPLGPVLHLDELLGQKVSALATRSEVRDYLDVAAALRRYDRQRLLDLARRADPDLVDDEFADAMQRLDQLDDDVFRLQYGLSPARIRQVRKAFSDWPR